MTLFELSDEYAELKRIQEILSEIPEEEKDELQEKAVNDTFEMVQLDFLDKADGYGMVLKNLEASQDELKAQEEILKAEAARLAARRKALERNADRLKEAMLNAMIATGQSKIKTDKFTFGTRKSSSLVITTDNVFEIPDDLLRYKEPEPDKAAIKEYMKDHPDVSWARIETKQSLSVR